MDYDYDDYDDYDYNPTGDPMRDREFAEGGKAEGDFYEAYIPEPVKKFLLDLRDHISAGNVFETSNLYENTYPKLTEDFFKTSAWPEADVVEQYVGGEDSLFLILYRELYYRHIYARVQGGPSIEERFESYYNYCNLFNYILSSESPVKLVLPDQWQWEIIDESLHSTLKDKTYAEKMNKMSSGDVTEFEACFTFACPKFLSAIPPSLEEPPSAAGEALHKEPLRLQMKVFMDEVKQQMLLPTVRSYLKLYTSMPLEKLADYMGITVDELEMHLLCFKHKMMNKVWSKGTSGLEGDFQSESEVDFYIDKNMIHIADTKVDRRYGDFFIRQIHKFEELHNSIKAMKK